MKLPETVKVGPYRYRVICDETAMLRASVADKKSLAGHAAHSKQEIVVDASLPPDYLADTLLHEVLHCVQYVSGFPEGKHTGEELVEAISATLLGVLRDNPMLVAYLTEAP